jgi:hypothetical protein
MFSGLDTGLHTIVLTHASKNIDEWTDFDSAVVSRWDGSFDTRTSSDTPDTVTASQSVSLAFPSAPPAILTALTESLTTMGSMKSTLV